MQILNIKHLGIGIRVLPHKLLHSVVPAGQLRRWWAVMGGSTRQVAGQAGQAQTRRVGEASKLSGRVMVKLMKAWEQGLLPSSRQHKARPAQRAHHLQARLLTSARQAWLAPPCMVLTTG